MHLLDEAILNEHFEGRAAFDRRVLAKASAPVEVNVTRFVAGMIDGKIGHARYEWKGEALADIRVALEEHYRRPLTFREGSELVNVVARAWTDREEARGS